MLAAHNRERMPPPPSVGGKAPSAQLLGHACRREYKRQERVDGAAVVLHCCLDPKPQHPCLAWAAAAELLFSRRAAARCGARATIQAGGRAPRSPLPRSTGARALYILDYTSLAKDLTSELSVSHLGKARLVRISPPPPSFPFPDFRGPVRRLLPLQGTPRTPQVAKPVCRVLAKLNAHGTILSADSAPSSGLLAKLLQGESRPAVPTGQAPRLLRSPRLHPFR